MYDSNFVLPLAGCPTGHVPWLGTTVNPADTLLTQPPRGLVQSDGIPQNVAASQDFVGYPVGDAPQETLQCHHAPVQSSQYMSQPLGLFPEINDDSARQFAGATRPTRRRFRGVRVGDTVLTTCQWQYQGSSVCGQEITGEAVPKHLAGHGIQNMRSDHIVWCDWRECGVRIKRRSITRHYREVHLGLKRKTSL